MSTASLLSSARLDASTTCRLLAWFTFLLPAWLSAAPATVDAQFAATAGQVFSPDSYGGVASVLVQRDGKILFGSNEMPGTVSDQTLQMSLIRFHPDGTVDNTFFSDNEPDGAGTGIYYDAQGTPEVHALGELSDGRIIAAGVMQGMRDGNNSYVSNSIVCLQSDGTVDTAFVTAGTTPWPTGGFNYIEDVTVLQDDSVLIVGGFGGVRDTVGGTSQTRYGIARLLPNGSVDTGFQLNPYDFGVPTGVSYVRGYFSQANVDAQGRIYVAGHFEWNTTFPAPYVNVLARLFPNGSLDTSFSPAIPSTVSQVTGVVVQPDGKILVLGEIANPQTDTWLVRFQSDGTLDNTFVKDPGLTGRLTARPLQVDAEGRVLLAQYRSSQDRLVRLLPDGSQDTSFDAVATWENQTDKQPYFGNFTTANDGKIYAGSFFNRVEGVSTVKLVAFEGDSVTPQIKLSTTTLQVVENAGLAYVPVVRLGNATGIASVDFLTLAGTAEEEDFSAASGTLTWADGENGVKYITVPITQDALSEIPESFSVILSNALGTPLAQESITLVTIVDDDTAPVILADPQSISAREGATVLFQVRVTCPVPVTYQWLKNGVAIPGATARVLTITGVDADDEAAYSVEVTNPQLPSSPVTSASAILTVIPPALGVDASWVPASGLSPNSLAVFPDGSSLTVDGTFGGTYTLKKFTPSGSLDPTFVSPTIVLASGYTSPNYQVWILPDGRILVRGAFVSINGTARIGLARLLADGTLDASFNANFAGLANNSSVVVTASGTVYAHYRPTNQEGGLRRLLDDGSFDPNFTTTVCNGQSGYVYAGLEMADGSLVFSYVSGTNGLGITRGIIRLQSHGAAFPGFTTTTSLFPQATSLAFLPDGRFAAVRNTLLEVYRADGTVDPSFSLSATFTGNLTKVVYHRGRLIVSGPTSYGTTLINGLAAFDLNGIFDDNFPGGSGPNASVTGFEIDALGRFLAFGNFTTWNNVTRARLVRLNFDTPEVALYRGVATLVEDGSPLTVSVVRYGNPAGVGSVRVVSSNGTALAGTHFQAIDQTLSWAAGDASPKSFTLTPINGSSIDGDLQFTVQLNNGTGVGILPPTLTVTIKDDDSYPRITSQPVDVQGVTGLPVTFSVTATSPSSLSYQWYFNNTPITNATGQTYTINSVAAENVGEYKVVLTNAYGATTSQIARLTIIPNPAALVAGFTGLSLNGSVRVLAPSPDGGAYVGGEFTDVGGVATRDFLIKVTPQGTLDNTFTPGQITGASPNYITEIVVQPDGKILLSGTFSSIAGTTVRGLARLLPDGSLDGDFHSKIGVGSNGDTFAVALFADGRIAVGGSFTSWNGVSLGSVRDLVRLLPDGTLDGAYSKTSATSSILDLEPLSDGKLLASHNTSTGNAVKVTRFLADRSADATFVYGNGKTKVDRIQIAADGDYLFASGSVLKINPDASTDTTFPTLNFTEVAQQNNGKILAAGTNGTATNRLLRYLSNASADAIFPTGTGFNGHIHTLALLEDGRIWVGGSFTTFNSVNASRLVLLQGDEIPLALLTQPASLLRDPGQSATFTARAIGTSAISYQWYKGSDAVTDDLRISGAQTNTLTLTNLSEADEGTYTLMVTNISGSQTSLPAILTMRGAPEIKSLSSPVTLLAGNHFSLTVVADGVPDLSYEWRWEGQALPNGGRIAGANTATLTVSSAEEADSGDYTVQISNGYGSLTSGSIQVVVQPNGALLANGFVQPVVTNPGGYNSGVLTILPLPGNRALLGGRFLSISDGTTTSGRGLAVVAEDGSVTAVPLVLETDAVYDLCFQPDGKILVAGGFVHGFGGATPRYNLIRLHPDLTLDESFHASGFTNLYRPVYDVAVEPSGTLMAAGNFDDYDLLPNTANIVRLTDTGAHDPSFISGANLEVRDVLPLANGDLLINGSFDPWGGLSGKKWLIRVDSSGTPFTGVDYQLYYLYFLGLHPLADGSLFAQTAFLSDFWRYAPGQTSRDTTFTPANNGQIYSLTEDSAGNILAGGTFTTFLGPRNRIVRLLPNRALDPTFDIGSGFNDVVDVIAVSSSGKYWVGGAFTTYRGTPASRLVLLQGIAPTSDPLVDYLASFGVPNDQQNASDNPDGDPWDNLIEFAYGLNPMVFDHGFEPISSTGLINGATLNSLTGTSQYQPTENYYRFEVLLPVDSQAVTLEVEGSRSLDFTNDPVPLIQVGTPVIEGNYERTIHVFTVPLGTAQAGFVRLSALGQPNKLRQISVRKVSETTKRKKP